MANSVQLHTEVKLEAAHRVPNHDGKCKYLHGHSWRVLIDIEGTVCEDAASPDYGMVVDFAKVKAVPFQYDHDYFNAPARGQLPIANPTAETLSTYFAQEIRALSPRIEFVHVIVEETEGNAASADA